MPVLVTTEIVAVGAQVIAIGTAVFAVYVLGWGLKRVRSAL